MSTGLLLIVLVGIWSFAGFMFFTQILENTPDKETGIPKQIIKALFICLLCGPFTCAIMAFFIIFSLFISLKNPINNISNKIGKWIVK